MIRALSFSLLSALLLPIQIQDDPISAAADPTWTGLYQVQQKIDPSHSRYLTAFRVPGRFGLYTCLHGVLEGALKPQNTVSVSQRWTTGDQTFFMKVQAVDIEDDLAYLVPVEGGPTQEWKSQVEGPDRFTFSSFASYQGRLRPGQNLIVTGSPGSSGFVQTKTGAVTLVSNHDLRHLLDKTFADYIQDRRSPDIDRYVIPFDAPVNQGESGSPVLAEDAADGRTKLIGVVDGRAYAGHIWAIPVDATTFSDSNPRFLAREAAHSALQKIADVDQTDATARQKEAASNALGRPSLTAFDSDVPPTACGDLTSQCLRQGVRLYKQGRLSLVRGAQEQFYIWLDIPKPLHSNLKEVEYRIAGVTDHASGIWHFIPGDHPLRSTTCYANALYFDPARGLAPWLGGTWDQTETVHVSAKLTDGQTLTADLPLPEIRFDQPPPESLRKPDTKDCSK